LVASGRSKIGIIAYGTTHWAITESRDQLRGEYGLETDYLRLRGFPFSRKSMSLWKAHDRLT